MQQLFVTRAIGRLSQSWRVHVVHERLLRDEGRPLLRVACARETQELLLNNMCYFQTYLSGDRKYEDIDISVRPRARMRKLRVARCGLRARGVA